ncbi:MAG TPA: hypothetical protein VLE53_02925 [Gemmatimonadaceae bacterium]|nr:hypothetical protein [Gemmatimonadaceae bacterium]
MVLSRWASRDLDWRRWAVLLVAAYLVVGLVGFRRTLIPDEIRPLLLAAEPWSVQLEITRQDLVQTPASFILARWWLALFGHTDAASKTLALLLNVPTIVLFTYLARRVTAYWPAASLLCALALMRIGSAPNLVRMYGLLLLCVVAAMVLWVHWRERPRGGLLAAWVAVMVLAAYTHLSALLLLPAFVIATWLFGPARRVFTAAAVAVPLALLPWANYVRGVYEERGIHENVQAIRDDPTRAVAKLPFYVLSGEDPGAGSPLGDWYRRWGIPATLKWGAVLLLAGLIGIPLAFRARDGPRQPTESGRESHEWFRVSAVLVATPLLVLYVFSLAFTPVVHARYLLVCLPAFWLFLATAARLSGPTGRVLFAATGVWVLASVGVALWFNRGPSPARSAADFLAMERRPPDVVVVDRLMPLGWQLTWEWRRRLGRREPLVVLSLPWTQPWWRDVIPTTPLETLRPDTAGRVWFLRQRLTRDSAVVAHLRGQGFVPSRAEVPSPGLQLFERLRPDTRFSPAALP